MYCASDVCITSKLWLIKSSNDAGPTLSMMNEPVADRGAPEDSGAAAGCWASGSADSIQELIFALWALKASCSRINSCSACLRRNGIFEPRELIRLSKRDLNAAGRWITGSW
ncbi:hypothetical protein FQZ97_1194800 [compost metagenome]